MRRLEKENWRNSVQNRVTVRMTEEMFAQIDSWIARQPGYVSRQEAVRRLLAISLEGTEQHMRPHSAEANPTQLVQGAGSR